MTINADEITEVLKSYIENYTATFEESTYGSIIQVGDNITRIYGLSDARAGELVLFENGTYGIIMNLEEYCIGCVILGSDVDIQEGQSVKRTGKIARVPVGKQLLGRAVNPLGIPIDGKGPIKAEKSRPVEFPAPRVIDRQPVSKPLYTGIKAIDSLVPIGRGQREMIIGDRQTGKTAIAIDTILNQTPEDVYCIYVAIGQKTSSVASVIEILRRYDKLKNTTIVMASANEPASLLYLAPYAGCAIAEEYMYNGEDALVIYDDLTKHANAYRELSLLLRRPPGREAYPGDVFYLHSRLLERSARLSDMLGGGSSTALPIVETQMGDVSAYIPTNIISITDGQIYLDRDLFHKGIRPAVDVGLSVSRVGGSAQIPAMKKVAAPLRLDLAQFRELEAFMKFSSEELEKGCRSMMVRGKRITEVLKQNQFNPVSAPYQIAVLYSAARGHIDDLPLDQVQVMETMFISFLKGNFPQYENQIRATGEFTRLAEDILLDAIHKFKKIYLTEYIGHERIESTREDSFHKRIWKEIEEEEHEAEEKEEELEAGLEEVRKFLGQ